MSDDLTPDWTEGLCGDGAAILRDGVMIKIEEVVQTLNDYEHLRVLLCEGLDLCVRARKLDTQILAGNMADQGWTGTRSGTPWLWVQEQYDTDLADWEKRARNDIKTETK
jgi:hypothetical protein